MQRNQPTPSEVETLIRQMCRSGGMREPDRVEQQADGDLIAFWEDEKVAVVIEMDR